MRFAALLVLVVVLALVGCGSGNATTTSASLATTTTGAAVATTTTTSAAATTTTSASATTTTSAATTTGGSAAWQKVFEFSNYGNERTETFTLSGAPCRLTYKVTSDKSTMAFATYLLPEGYDLDKKGGFPDVFITDVGADSIELTKDAGSYFLEVKAANCDYTITIEEQK